MRPLRVVVFSGVLVGSASLAVVAACGSFSAADAPNAMEAGPSLEGAAVTETGADAGPTPDGALPDGAPPARFCAQFDAAAASCLDFDTPDDPYGIAFQRFSKGVGSVLANKPADSMHSSPFLAALAFGAYDAGGEAVLVLDSVRLPASGLRAEADVRFASPGHAGVGLQIYGRVGVTAVSGAFTSFSNTLYEQSFVADGDATGPNPTIIGTLMDQWIHLSVDVMPNNATRGATVIASGTLGAVTGSAAPVDLPGPFDNLAVVFGSFPSGTPEGQGPFLVQLDNVVVHPL